MGYSLLASVLASLVLVSLVYAEKPEFLGKKYKLTESDDGFDDVMKALGVGFITRNLAKTQYPVVSVTEKDGKYTLRTESFVKNHEIHFELGKVFYQETIDGRKNVKTTMTLDGNKLTESQSGDKMLTTIREFLPGQMITTVKINGKTSKRTYTLLKA